MAATEILCRGEVVRQVGPAGEGMSPTLAARILDYHFHQQRIDRNTFINEEWEERKL